MLLTRFEPAATNEFWRAVMTRCPSSCSLASIHYKRRRRKNVDPLIRIAPAWYWAKAMMELFGEVPVSSTKSMMGHSLGAAGAIEAVVSLLALQHQFLPPNINFREAELSLNIVANQPRDAQFDCAVSNSFGFGGTNATIVLRKLAR